MGSRRPPLRKPRRIPVPNRAVKKWNRIQIGFQQPHVIDDVLLATLRQNGVPHASQGRRVEGLQREEANRRCGRPVPHPAKWTFEQGLCRPPMTGSTMRLSGVPPIDPHAEHRRAVFVRVEEAPLQPSLQARFPSRRFPRQSRPATGSRPSVCACRRRTTGRSSRPGRTHGRRRHARHPPANHAAGVRTVRRFRRAVEANARRRRDARQRPGARWPREPRSCRSCSCQPRDSLWPGWSTGTTRTHGTRALQASVAFRSSSVADRMCTMLWQNIHGRANHPP